MTQMLLFDAPAAAAPLGTAIVASAEVAATAVRSKPTKVIASAPQEVLVGESERRTSDGGPHHIGDLARLVLLRYELMAKRREQLAKRQSAVGMG
jgi:hypothetical protein